MNPGPVEEVGLTARAAVDIFKSNPILFAIVLFNIAYMIGTYWFIHSAGERWERLLETTLKLCSIQK